MSRADKDAEFVGLTENIKTGVSFPHSKKRQIILWVVALIVVVLGVLGFLFHSKIVELFAGNLVDSSETTPEQPTVTDPALARFISPKTGETWLAKPVDMTPQGWLKIEQRNYYQNESWATIEQQMEANKPTYQEIGKRAGNKIIMVSYAAGPGLTQLIFEQHPDGTVAMIVRPQSTAKPAVTLEQAKDFELAGTVKVFEESVSYDSLSVPHKLVLPSGEEVSLPEYASIGTPQLSGDIDVDTTVVRELGASKLVKTQKAYADTKLTNIGYFVETPIGTRIGMTYEPNKSSLEGYTFTNGAQRTVTFKNVTTGEEETRFDTIEPIARGCGAALAAVTRSDELRMEDLTPIGTSSAGKTIYGISNKNADLYKKAYDEYAVAARQLVDVQPVAFDEFLAQHGLVIIPNKNQEILVYVRSRFQLVGGCAKPVVYLYPTAPTTVSVRVGADVTVSDPHYPAGGWHGVYARPNGLLTYQGRQYTSLFWEGEGHGSYPGIQAGSVVRRDEAPRVIREQLEQQGLQGQEVTDFMDFWTDKIPNKPYIRLTWLTQSQLDNLAPLTIAPKPTTVIRVFLDMGGFDTLVSLLPQQLSAKPRTGFTVVEWGGLTSEVRH